jgi:truncated hemoglobin YjbI
VAHKDVENAAKQQRNSDVFDRIGGKEAMVAAVDLFYEKVGAAGVPCAG